MSIIKENIRFTGNDIHIQIPIGGNLEFTGYQQEIEEYTNIKTANSINEATDGEVSKFRLKKNNYDTKKIKFSFSSGSGDNYVTAGFEEDEVRKKELNFLNSFYILDFFDSPSPTNQTKIFSAYLTNLDLFVEQSGPLPKSVYRFEEDFQLYNLYIPIGYLTLLNNTRTYVGYSRFSFYNGKTGKIDVFYNVDNGDKTTPEKMFFETKLNIYDRTWTFLAPSFQSTVLSTAFARKLVDSDEYVERFNDTFEDFNNLQQNYPNNTTFNYLTGKYFTPET